MKEILKKKVEKFSNELLLESLKGMSVEDWKNWGDTIERMIAEEASKRGLIK